MGKSLVRLIVWLFPLSVFALMMGVCFDASVGTAELAGWSYEAYAGLLSKYVDDLGMVDYSGLKADGTPMDNFVSNLSSLDPHLYENWNTNAKIAFWINAYNALTLKAIMDHYPIKASFFKYFMYPNNSIRQIPGVWDKLMFTVMGRDYTLDGIEHKVLRTSFNEPRIHMALVCAAKGCPPLRNEPYTGSRLDAQLDDQAAKFLKNPDKFMVDRDNRKVYLSPIFQWFGQDFVKNYGGGKNFPGFSEREKAILNFVSRYIGPTDQEYLARGDFSLEYLKYDWSLNDKRP